MWPSFQYSKNGAEAVEWRNVGISAFSEYREHDHQPSQPRHDGRRGPSTLDYTFCHVHESPIIV